MFSYGPEGAEEWVLHEFLERERNTILAACEAQLLREHPGRSKTDLNHGLSDLYDSVLHALEREAGGDGGRGAATRSQQSSEHGKQRHALGFSVSQLVHDYGALCHNIFQIADAHHVTAQPLEYRDFNQLLDDAIADSVTSYIGEREQRRDADAEQRAAKHLGFIAHELRNSLSRAMLAFEALHRLPHGTGRTATMLGRSLANLRTLIDNSLSEVRLTSGQDLRTERVQVSELLQEVEAASVFELEAKSIHLVMKLDENITCLLDRQLLISAVTNLLQNAIKFTPPHGTIELRLRRVGDEVVIEVEDQCGGLPPGEAKDFFQPFVQRGRDRSGVGLGLAIARQAVEAHRGTISVEDRPGKGCVFVIHVPGDQRESDVNP